jgi:DNA-binding NarL/FixJ family response regulator
MENQNVQPPGTRVRLLLADDNADFLRETRDLLSEDFDLLATAQNGLRLVAAAQQLKPDIVVTDISMPELNGIEAGRRILKLGVCKAVIILSVVNAPEIVRTAFDAGIRGYVLKENAGEELISAIRSAIQGDVFLSSGIRSKLVQNVATNPTI